MLPPGYIICYLTKFVVAKFATQFLWLNEMHQTAAGISFFPQYKKHNILKLFYNTLTKHPIIHRESISESKGTLFKTPRIVLKHILYILLEFC